MCNELKITQIPFFSLTLHSVLSPSSPPGLFLSPLLGNMPFPAAQPPQRGARPGAQLARLGGASRQAHGAQPAQGPLPPQTCPGVGPLSWSSDLYQTVQSQCVCVCVCVREREGERVEGGVME